MTSPHEPMHEHWEELAAGFALDALEPAEEHELLTHLAGCPSCRRVLDEHIHVAAQLGALAEDAQSQPPSWSAIRAGVVGDTAKPPRVVSLDEQRRRRRQPRILGAAAAVVLLAAAGVVGWQLSSDDSDGSDRSRTVAACAVSPGCHVVRLQGDSNERAVVLAENGTATIVPTNMSAPPPGKVYALWQLPRDGKPTLVTVLRTVDNGVSSAAPLALPYDETAAFAVSTEPSGSVPTQPTEVIATGTATA